jgi:hypothetical protein
LKSVSIKKMAEPPAAPADTSIIGLAYDGRRRKADQALWRKGDSEIVSFDTSQDKEGVYTVEIGEASGTFTVKASQSVSPRVINWWLIGGFIFIVTAIAMFVVLSVKRSAA